MKSLKVQGEWRERLMLHVMILLPIPLGSGDTSPEEANRHMRCLDDEVVDRGHKCQRRKHLSSAVRQVDEVSQRQANKPQQAPAGDEASHPGHHTDRDGA